MKDTEQKYIELILKRCLSFKNTKSLMIHCDLKEHLSFANRISLTAKEMGINDICIHINDLDEIHDYLKKTNLEDIKVNPIIDRSDWNTYAKKGACLLFITSNVPGLMSDISSLKIKKWVDERVKTTPYYHDNVSKNLFPWCIVSMPNERWAKSIFGESEDSYYKLFNCIEKMCMLDKKDPILEWKKLIIKSNEYKDKLNKMNIKSLHYKNSIGTDLKVGLPDNILWMNLDEKDINGNSIIANMPSYEIFTTPDYRKVEGIVYSSKPLYYNGCLIDNFWLKFKEGKVVEIGAKQGYEELKQLIFENENACYLGEVALVPFDSPISNTKIVFNETLFDENASCHLALGDGFANVFKDFNKKTDKQLNEEGMNISLVHVDFMIGTSDLEITAETETGEQKIFKNGNFVI